MTPSLVFQADRERELALRLAEVERRLELARLELDRWIGDLIAGHIVDELGLG